MLAERAVPGTNGAGRRLGSHRLGGVTGTVGRTRVDEPGADGRNAREDSPLFRTGVTGSCEAFPLPLGSDLPLFVEVPEL